MTDNRQTLMRGYVDAVVDRRDLSPYFAPDVVWRTMETGEEVVGAEAVADYIRVFHTVLFDAAPRVKSVVVAGDFACLEADFVGRHTAELAGVPPTGAEVDVAYCVTYGLSDAGITWIHAYVPVSQLVGQLTAAAPAQAQA
jgi:ketosteroid isomerase-like protein